MKERDIIPVERVRVTRYGTRDERSSEQASEGGDDLARKCGAFAVVQFTSPCVNYRVSNVISNLGARVRACRKRLGWSQERLAAEAEIDRTAVAKIESGDRNIRVETLAKLARGLRTSMASLLEGLDDERPSKPAT